MAISDTCFINNDFVGAGVVVASNTTTFNESSTYGTTGDDLTCQFAVLNDECVAYSSNICTSEIYSGDVAPNSSPMNAPIPAPSPSTDNSMNNSTSASLRRRYLPHLSLLLCVSLCFVVNSGC